MFKNFAIISFAFFVLSGHFNNFPFIDNLPIDITILSLFIPITYFVLFFLIKLEIHKSFFVILLFFIPFTITLNISSFQDDKLFSFLAVFLTATIISPVLLNDNKSINLFFKSLLITALLICTSSIVTLDFNFSGRLTLLGSNPIWLGRAVAIGLLIITVSLIHERIKLGIFIILASPMLFALISTGSKGPFFSYLLVIFLIFIKDILILIARKKTVIRALHVSFVGLPVLFITYLLLPDNTIVRMFNFQEEGSVNVRKELYLTAINIIKQYPNGIGLGNFGNYTTLNNNYPHNIILEMFSEMGWLNGLLFIMLLIISFIGLTKIRSLFTRNLLISLFLLSLFNSFVSGDLTSPKEIYILVPLGINYFIAQFRVKNLISIKGTAFN
ncbi:O-antigen ligase family protein [Gracilibacillus thailandensis]|uniref:O-antigen ligase-related domain-containing protein n=1 Tax=Gracilibacillus thailandensis TaxID=563735 RepID=A0A6N7QYY4_9BACI|nr:O-antigen ligase family protein [Gracilibacillus thailandensis]MRI67353.1 hypothetical protein [Gracilibacillus thailandensis]